MERRHFLRHAPVQRFSTAALDPLVVRVWSVGNTVVAALFSSQGCLVRTNLKVLMRDFFSPMPSRGRMTQRHSSVRSVFRQILFALAVHLQQRSPARVWTRTLIWTCDFTRQVTPRMISS